MGENNNETPMKKKNIGLVAVLAIIIIAILVGVGYYFLRPTAPKDVFVGGINSVFENSTKQLGEDVKKINTTVTLSGNIESEDEEIKQVAQYINEGKLTYNVQYDKDAKKVLLSANVDYQNENLLSGKLYYANGDDNVYVFVQDLFDKYFKFNLDEAAGTEELSSIKDLFNEKETSKDDAKKAASIIKTTIENNLKDEYFSKEKVDGLTRNIMKLTVGEFKQMVKTISTSLKDNQDFIKCFEKADKIKEALEDIIKEIDDIDSEDDSKNIEVSLYTKGMKSEVAKLEIKVEVSETEQLIMTLVETEENKYELNADVPELGKVNLNMEVKNETATDINENVTDSVDINNMTQADQLKMLGNLMNMKIYQYIAPLLQNGM